METYDIEELRKRRKEDLLMQMYVHRNDPDYIDTRPGRQLCNHNKTISCEML